MLFAGYLNFQVILEGTTQRTVPCNPQQFLDMVWQPEYAYNHWSNA